jgi:magnesium transporter
MVLLFPIYNRQTREIEPSEIDFFISKDFLITIHDDKLPVMQKLFGECQTHGVHPQIHCSNPILLTTEITNRQLGLCLPMLDHISLDLHAIERLIFRDQEKAMVREILIARRNVVDFRKIMQAHKYVMKKLGSANRSLGLFDTQEADILLNNAIERTKEIWDHLEAFKEAVEALQQTNESLISFRLNDIMKTYTSISVIIFTLTLVATIINVRLPHTPLIETQYGFYFLLITLGVVASISVLIFKRRRWI